MSYIHDALKASSRQREALQAGQPGAPEPAPPEQKDKTGGTTGRVLLILLLLLLGFWFWRGASGPLPRESDVIVPPEAVPDVPAPAPVLPEAEPDQSSRPRTEELKGVRIELNAPAANPPRQVAQPLPAVAESKPSVDADQEPQAEASDTSVDVEEQPEDPYSQLPYLRQLPAEQQRELSGLRFSVHIYAEEPGARLVKYEDRVLREGSFVRSGLRIVEIIPRGVVLQYRETRFKVPAL